MLHHRYKLSSEEFGPTDLVRQAVRAEAAGFDFALISDHFHPWTDRQGHETEILPRLRPYRASRRGQPARRRAA